MEALRTFFAVLPASVNLVAAQQWQLVDTLYAPWRSILDGAVAIFAVAVICFLRNDAAWYLVWGLACACVAAGRLWGTKRYFVFKTGKNFNTSDDEPRRWAIYFMEGAALAAASWGVGAAAVIASSHDLCSVSLVLMMQAAWVALAITRNNASPGTASLQLLLALLPGFAAAFWAQDHGLRIVLIFAVLQIPACLKLTRVLTNQTLEFLESRADVEDLNEQLREINAELGQSNHRLRNLSTTDGLTDITNRRGLDEILRREWRRAARENGCVGLALIDVDHFKKYNDTYGHLAGDQCLQVIARTLVAQLQRGSDLGARFGGEEFAVLLPATPPGGVIKVAERVRFAVQALAIEHSGNGVGVVTISVGVAYARPKSHEGIRSFIDEADQALYLAKQSGRNRISLAAGLEEVIG